MLIYRRMCFNSRLLDKVTRATGLNNHAGPKLLNVCWLQDHRLPQLPLWCCLKLLKWCFVVHQGRAWILQLQHRHKDFPQSDSLSVIPRFFKHHTNYQSVFLTKIHSVCSKFLLIYSEYTHLWSNCYSVTVLMYRARVHGHSVLTSTCTQPCRPYNNR